MNAKTRKLLLATLGGALIVIGVLLFYNTFKENFMFYGIAALFFLAVGGFSLYEAFQ